VCISSMIAGLSQLKSDFSAKINKMFTFFRAFSIWVTWVTDDYPKVPFGLLQLLWLPR
jgi:hypothetical protein